MKEYFGYNFIGFIIGLCGNMQKRMEKEMGAKIVIRGKGFVKEGRLQQKCDLKFDLFENEDLYVLVEVDMQEAVDVVVGMVEKFLQSVDEVFNEYKRQQFREFVAFNGIIRDEEYCRLCGEFGYRQFVCSFRGSIFKSDVLCKICGDGGYSIIDCSVKGSIGKKMDDEYQNFLVELGGTVFELLIKLSFLIFVFGLGSLGINFVLIGVSVAISVLKFSLKDYDETNLYIGYLLFILDDDTLI